MQPATTSPQLVAGFESGAVLDSFPVLVSFRYVSPTPSSSRPSVCLSVCPQHNSKTNDSKVFKLGIGNDIGIS